MERNCSERWKIKGERCIELNGKGKSTEKESEWVYSRKKKVVVVVN